ncbi:hypothetical protein ABIE41_002675 [Bosea sp. OAE506]|uniref:HTH-like domain-containing protein n=1 Tax=Bosea sp. OAE506 TaxID=2663870 RepID=UPI001789B9E1
MTIEQAAAILARMYGGAGLDEKVVQIHLFGIKYAEDIQHMSAREIAERADIPKSYATEINKGKRLARFVRALA